MCTGPIFLTKNIIGVYNTNPLFQKKFIHCTLVIPFILHWPSFLNQARAWFLKTDPVRIVGMRAWVRVCVSAPEAINN